MKKITFLLITLAAVCFSCSKDHGPKVSADEREVELSFLLPGAYTRVATEAEKEIKNLTLLIFDGPDDTSKYLYTRYAWKKTGRTYSTTLRIGPGYTIYFSANTETILADLEDAQIDTNSTWAEVREVLKLDSPQTIDIEAKGLPMWGVAKNVEIEDKAANHLGPIQLIRSVASVEVVMLASNFTMDEGHVVYASNTGYLPYDHNNMTLDDKGYLRADGPFSPPGFTTNVDLKYEVPVGDTEILGQFYIYDNNTPIENNTTGNRLTKVVLKGTWTDPAGSGNSTYYPLSLRDKVAKDTYEKKQITRNNKYTIFVGNVHGDGYKDLNTARDADDVNSDYDVIEWDDNGEGDIIIDGSKYFYRGSSSVTLYRQEGSVGYVYFRTNYKHEEIQFKFEDDADYYTLTHDDHPRFKVEIVKGTGGGYDYFKITAKQDYGTTDNPGDLEVFFGRSGFNINIQQVDTYPNDWNNGGGIVVTPGN